MPFPDWRLIWKWHLSQAFSQCFGPTNHTGDTFDTDDHRSSMVWHSQLHCGHQNLPIVLNTGLFLVLRHTKRLTVKGMWYNYITWCECSLTSCPGQGRLYEEERKYKCLVFYGTSAHKGYCRARCTE